ncbi:MAG: response regulator [Phycisphaerae bacterium]|jgi:DNA-binding NtrC family response regulator
MKANKILIVDDEKNIRMTVIQSLEEMNVEIDTAVNGEEALDKLEGGDFGLALLDLRMPGIDGMQVLEKLRRERPDVKIIIVSAHGTINSAVEAMKQGAVDFIQKPFTPKEIRELVSKFIQRESTGEGKSQDYDSCLILAKQCVKSKHLEAAVEHAKKAISLDSSRPEAFNFLGALCDIQGDKLGAQKNYRAALSLDSAYKPAQDNLSRSTRANLDADQKIKLDEKTSY